MTRQRSGSLSAPSVGIETCARPIRDLTRLSLATLASQAGQVAVPTFNQRDPLLPAPALNLLLDVERLIDSLELLGPDEAHGSPTAGVRGATTRHVLRDPFPEVPGRPDVEAPVGALEHVGEWHAPIVAATQRQARAMRPPVDNLRVRAPGSGRFRRGLRRFAALPGSTQVDAGCAAERLCPAQPKSTRAAPLRGFARLNQREGCSSVRSTKRASAFGLLNQRREGSPLSRWLTQPRREAPAAASNPPHPVQGLAGELRRFRRGLRRFATWPGSTSGEGSEGSVGGGEADRRHRSHDRPHRDTQLLPVRHPDPA